MALPKVGNKAPAFSLLNADSNKIALKDFVGKNVVVYFYPRAMTPGCTVQAEGIRDSASKLKKANTVVLGISPDEPKKLERFIEKKDLNFELLSDPDHKICEKYGIWGLKKFMGKEFMGVKRTTFVVNSKGKITHIMEKVNTKTHHEDILKIIKETC